MQAILRTLIRTPGHGRIHIPCHDKRYWMLIEPCRGICRYRHLLQKLHQPTYLKVSCIDSSFLMQRLCTAVLTAALRTAVPHQCPCSTVPAQTQYPATHVAQHWHNVTYPRMDMSEGQHEFFGILIGIPFSGTTLFLGTIKHEKERYFKTYLFLHVPFKKTCKKDSNP